MWRKKFFEILKLSVPFEDYIASRHKVKADNYVHFCTDIITHNTTVSAFEVGARGFLTNKNLKRLNFTIFLCCFEKNLDYFI